MPQTTVLSPDQARAQALRIKRQRDLDAHPEQRPVTLPLFEEYPNDPATWIEKHFFIPETPDHKTILMPYQRECLTRALTRDSQGNFPYSLILWSDIKKSIKSMIAGAVALWMAWNNPWSSIKIVANDLKQADSREAFYIRRAIELHPEMRKLARVKPSGYLIELPNHARIESIPVDPKGEAGGNDDMIIFVELWAANNEAAQRMWTEMTVSPTKYGKSFRWVETYAGFNGKSPLLEQLYDVGVKDGDRKGMRPAWAKQFDPQLDVFINPITRTFNLWNKVPRCPWQTPQYYCLPLPEIKNELSVLTESGWVPAADITLDHKICTQNKDGIIEYQQPTSIFKDRYSGDLLRLKHTKADIVMTPNHRVFGAFASHTRKVKGMLEDGLKFEYKTAEEASKLQIGWIPGHGNWKHEPLKEFRIENETYDGNDFVEFMAWYLSEGNVRADRRNPKVYYSMLNISQDAKANPEKYARIEALLLRMGVKFSKQKSGFTVFNARICRYVVQFGFSHNKFIPRVILDECSQEQIKLFFETYRDGDGSTSLFGGRISIYTNSDQMALDIMECGFKAGYRPKVGGSYSSAPEKGRLPIHHIHFMKSHIGWSFGDHRTPWTTEKAPENCVVWCPSLPNGNFYVMQGKTCYWTGNSEEQAILLPSEFNRVHRNEWSAPSDAFCPAAWWEQCKMDLPPDDKNATHIIAMDAAVDGDTFGLLMISGDNNDNFYVRYARAWKPKIGEHINYSEVEEEVNRLLDEYNVAEVCYDPYQLEDMSQRLRQSLKAHLFQFNQGTPRLIADKSLRDIIRDRRMHHDGDLELKDHVTNADAKSDGDKLRIVKRSQMLKIDLCVCLSMATARAVYWRI